MTMSKDIDSTIQHPGAIQINSNGAYIVDDDDFIYNSNELTETNDIELPFQQEEVSHLAIDIGGSLAKIVYFTKNPGSASSSSDGSGSEEDDVSGGRLNFYKLETEKIDEFIKTLDLLIKARGGKLHIMATGGGSFKFYDKIKEQLDLEITTRDEMECLISGLDFFIRQIPNEVFQYTTDNPMMFVNQQVEYPYMLVNIGSGVSMLKVDGPNEFTRVGGSSLGGGTLWGLLSLLTNAQSYDEMLTAAQRGDNSMVDMLVGDIYGTDYGKIGLKSTAIASSMGKVFQKENRQKTFNVDDISKSLLYAISNNIGQIAYLQAKIHHVKNIYFGGSYIRGHPVTMNTLSYAINFWSEGRKKAFFLRHEGYLGAVGAFVSRSGKK